MRQDYLDEVYNKSTNSGFNKATRPLVIGGTHVLIHSWLLQKNYFQGELSWPFSLNKNKRTVSYCDLVGFSDLLANNGSAHLAGNEIIWH